jgi:hypothetical protein
MADNQLNEYSHLWTTERDQVALFTVEYSGKQSYLIYHMQTQHIHLVADSELGRQLVLKMLENGVILLSDEGTTDNQQTFA